MSLALGARFCLTDQLYVVALLALMLCSLLPAAVVPNLRFERGSCFLSVRGSYLFVFVLVGWNATPLIAATKTRACGFAGGWWANWGAAGSNLSRATR